MHARTRGIQSKASSKQTQVYSAHTRRSMRLLSTVCFKNRDFIHIHIDTHIHANIQNEYITITEDGVINLRKNGLGQKRPERGRRSINLVLIYEILKDK